MVQGKEPKTDVLIANHLKAPPFESVEEELLREEEEVKNRELRTETTSTRVSQLETAEDFDSEGGEETCHTS